MPVAPEYLHLVYEGPFPAFLYGRVSRDPRKRGSSVADQLSNGRELCEEHGWPIERVFGGDIDRSASRHARKKRDDFEEMLGLIEAGACRIVVAWEASRYYRDLEAYVRLRAACLAGGVLLCYNGTIYDLSKREDRKATALDAVGAEDEVEGIRDRNLRTARATAKAGKPHGRLLYGYVRRYDPDTGDLIAQAPHPEQAARVAEAWERAAAGESNRAILRDFNRRRVPAPGGAPEWVDRHLYQLFRNPAYIGKRVHQGQIIRDATWPALTSLETWDAVQAIIHAPGRQYAHDNAVRHLVSGIGRCGGQCPGPGPVLRVRPSKGIVNYRCSERGDVVMKAEQFEAYVEEAVLTWLMSPAAAAAFDRKDRDEEAAAARVRLRQLEQQLEEARALASTVGPDGHPQLSVLSLAVLEQRLAPQIEQARQDAQPTTVPPVLRQLVGQPDADSVWEGLDLLAKRTVLRLIVTPRLHPARARGVRRIEPGRITMSWVGQPGFVGS